jgi:hypothetical protein
MTLSLVTCSSWTKSEQLGNKHWQYPIEDDQGLWSVARNMICFCNTLARMTTAVDVLPDLVLCYSTGCLGVVHIECYFCLPFFSAQWYKYADNQN